jgi:esterase/lipase
MIIENKNEVCFILLPGFAPDFFPVQGIMQLLIDSGFTARASNFWGDGEVKDFSKLTLPQVKLGVSQLIEQTAKKYKYIVGIGISLGGALLIEHAKSLDNLSCIVSIGTPFKLRNRFLIKLGFGVYPFIYFFWKYLQKIKRFRLSPIGCARVVIDFFEGDFIKNLAAVKTPILLLHSQKDYVTDGSVVPEFFEKIGSLNKELKYFKSSNHVIEYNSPLIVDTLIDFCHNLKT